MRPGKVHGRRPLKLGIHPCIAQGYTTQVHVHHVVVVVGHVMVVVSFLLPGLVLVRNLACHGGDIHTRIRATPQKHVFFL